MRAATRYGHAAATFLVRERTCSGSIARRFASCAAATRDSGEYMHLSKAIEMLPALLPTIGTSSTHECQLTPMMVRVMLAAAATRGGTSRAKRSSATCSDAGCSSVRGSGDTTVAT